ncbi:MAG: RNA polymerase subunit sigma-24 [Actinobacteria bacterium HGW-Actinobacteria-4]|nr:MAG: RNA polymerase subunit sigma-24 [Actinobacteria bacterium HGW-Actinobacteria-4]
MATWQPMVDELVTERFGRLVAYAAMLVGRDGDAEDLVHDALVKTFSRRRSFDHVAQAEAYVRKAMPSIVIDRARSSKSRMRATHRAFQREPSVADVDAGLDVRNALRTLPPREQVCIVLRFFDDLTVPQIAAQLGIAEGTVKRYLADASAKLATVLDASSDWEDNSERADVLTPSRKARS